jgi:vesicle coat complex subunit
MSHMCCHVTAHLLTPRNTLRTHLRAQAFERLPEMRSDMLSKLFENFSDLTSPEVARAALWIFGEYADNEETIAETIKHVKVKCDVPF